jgi:hypothetical protein
MNHGLWTIDQYRKLSNREHVSQHTTGHVPWSIDHGLIHKPPPHPKPYNHTRGGNTRGCKIVIDKSKTIPEADCIQVFCSQEAGKAFDPEMHKGMNVGEIFNGDRILGNKLAH